MSTKTFNLFPYQQKAVERHLKILDSVGASLDGTGCGGGKTVIASSVASRYALPTGVICPKSVIAKWTDTLSSFGIEPLFVLNPEKLRTGNTLWLAKIPGRGKTPNFKWSLPHDRILLIFDEAHMFGAHSSQNGKLLEAAQGHAVLMLSATAAESPLKMKAIGVNLRLFTPNYYWKWVREMGATESRWGGLEWDSRQPENKEKMERLHYSVFTNRGYRVSEEELRSELPELMCSDEPLWLTPKDRAEIKKLYEEMSDQEDPGGVKNLRQRQAVEIVKVPYLVEKAKEVVEGGGSVVLFLNFHASIDAARVHFDEGCVIDGREKPETRAKTQARFQRGELKVVVVQIAAGGQSIDLHDTTGLHPRVALLCPQFSGLVEQQALGRIARVGAKSRALAIRLYAGTLEQAALNVTSEKRENVEIFNSGEKSLNITTTPHVETPVSVITPQPEHSEHSPSSLKLKAICPGFRNDQTRDQSAAERGTLGHLAVEKENLDVIPPEDTRLREAAAMCLKYLAHLRTQCESAKEIRERRYKILDQFGHIDHLILHGNKCELVDYKFAFSSYEADSPQFWAYSVGVWDAHPETEVITAHVVLPFQGVIDVESWSRANDYQRLSAQTIAIIEAARRDNPDTYQTGTHCSWCGRRAACPKLNNLALAVASQYKPEELELPANYDPTLINDPMVMATAKRIAPVLKSWAEKVDQRALEMRLHEGIEIPGFELAERSAPFKIVDAQAAWDVVKDQITPEAFAGCAEVKIGDLEKAVTRVAKRGTMKSVKENLRCALLDANAAKSEGTVHFLRKTK